METNIQPLILTSISPQDFMALLRKGLDNYFSEIKTLQPNSNQTEDQILTVKEAALLVRRSVPSIYQLCNDGEIPSFKRGGKILFSKVELLAWAMGDKRKPLQETEPAAAKLPKTTLK